MTNIIAICACEKDCRCGCFYGGQGIRLAHPSHILHAYVGSLQVHISISLFLRYYIILSNQINRTSQIKFLAWRDDFGNFLKMKSANE